MDPNQFDYHGTILTRFDHMYNSTQFSERGVEIAVADHFLQENTTSRSKVLDVGNVLYHYDRTPTMHFDPPLEFPKRRVVDLYEVAQDVENIDLFDIEGEFDVIVAISTLEHVGQDYGEAHNLQASQDAVDYLRSLLKPKGKMLVTIPVGQHPTLKPETLGADREVFYARTTPPTRWVSTWAVYPVIEPGRRPLRQYPAYGKATPWASCVWVGEFFGN